VGGLSLTPIPEGELCCGSAGTYNLEHPATARQLGRRKAENILKTGAMGVVSGNIGCMVQIEVQLAGLQRVLPVWHTMQVLDLAYGGELGV
jgi:glycolate oxidase iron-sulfur subunit